VFFLQQQEGSLFSTIQVRVHNKKFKH